MSTTLRKLFYRVAPLSLPLFFGGGVSCGGQPDEPPTWAVALPEGSRFAGNDAPVPSAEDCQELCGDAMVESCQIDPGERGQSVLCVGAPIGRLGQAMSSGRDAGCGNYPGPALPSGCNTRWAFGAGSRW